MEENMDVSEKAPTFTMSTLLGSDEDLPVCSPCEHGGRVAEAHGYCRDCNEHLCEACYNSHLLPRFFRNHVLLDKARMPRVVLPPDDMCTKHKDQQLEYYCRNHDKLECNKCINIYHRTCESVSYIQDICDDIEDKENFKTLYKTLKDIEQDVVKNKTNATANLTDIETKISETREKIHSHRKYLDQHLDKMEEELCKAVDALGVRDKETIGQVSNECDTLTANVRSVIYNFDVSVESQQKMQIFITMKKTERAMNDWQNTLDEIKSRNRIQNFQFAPDKHSLSMGSLVIGDGTEQQPYPNVAGHNRDQGVAMSSGAKQHDQSQLRGNATGSTHMLNSPKDIIAKKDGRINISINSDSKDCTISGSAFIGDNQLVMADWENSSVKLLDLNQKKVINHLSLKRAPWDITRINEHTLAVTCPNGGYIQLVKVERFGTLTVGQQIKAGGECRGIRYIGASGGPGRFVVSFTGSNTVKIMDMSGAVLKDLSSDSVGQARFNIPYHIAINNDEKTLVVANRGDNTVTGLTLDGAVKFVYMDSELQFPRGVAVGDRGEIYQSSVLSGNIHLISSAGWKIKVLLEEKDEVENPLSITYSDNKLFVASQYNNFVDIYKIQYLQ